MIWINWLNEFCVLHARLQTIIEILDHNHLIDLAGIVKKLLIPVRLVNIEERSEESEYLQKGWYKNGQIRYEDNYVNGQKHGLGKSWFRNGQIAHEFNYANGQEHGLCRGWHSGGQKHGLCKWWYENGQISYEGNYVNGQRHGLCKGWHKNGQIRYEYNYFN